MKIAYIVLCHKNLDQTNQLINQLDNGLCDFYVHIDKKCATFNFDSSNVFLVPDHDRIDVKWAHVSMVYATLNAMKLVKATSREYDYVFLLSGQDFPIKSNDEIQAFLNQNKGSNFIEVLDHSSEDYLRYLKRNTLKYSECLMGRAFLPKALKKILIILTGGQNRTFSAFKRKNTTGVDFEFGSQWWAITYECFNWILNYAEEHKELLEYYKNCLTPDESFFQTIFMLSPYKDTKKDFLTYLEWDKNNNNPRILLENDIEMLINLKDKIFARKFDETVDQKAIMDLKNKIKD